MKYIENNKMYVQVRDLSFIFNHGEGLIPKSVFKKALSEVMHMDVNNMNNYIEFNEKDEIEYFDNQTYILDFDSIMNLSDEDLDNTIDLEERIIDRLFKTAKYRKKYMELIDLRHNYKKEYYRYKTLIRVKRFREAQAINNIETAKRNK